MSTNNKPIAPKNRLVKRIIPCLDIQNGSVAKGVKFENVREIGDPVALARKYESMGADELVFYDINASVEMRSNFLELVREVASAIRIPFTVGGGIRSVNDVYQALLSGADKVSINTAAILTPSLIKESALRFGNQCVVVSLDVKFEDGDYYVYTYGGRNRTPYKAVDWAIKCEGLGAGELVINAIDQDGVKKGYDLELLRRISKAVNLPVIASGGAGKGGDFVALFEAGVADAALAASVFHYDVVNLLALKDELYNQGVPTRRVAR